MIDIQEKKSLIYKNEQVFGFHAAYEQVQALLSYLPRNQAGYFYQMRLCPKRGEKFYFSIQASLHHYCSPREDLPKLTDYKTVEVGIFYNMQEGSSLKFIQPSKVDMFVIQDSSIDDVLVDVEVQDIVLELVTFFLNGGSIFIEPESSSYNNDENLLVVDSIKALPEIPFEELPTLPMLSED